MVTNTSLDAVSNLHQALRRVARSDPASARELGCNPDDRTPIVVILRLQLCKPSLRSAPSTVSPYLAFGLLFHADAILSSECA